MYCIDYIQILEDLREVGYLWEQDPQYHLPQSRSSTQSEIFGFDDSIPSILWTGNFLNSQDYDVTENIIFQDNKSAILLE